MWSRRLASKRVCRSLSSSSLGRTLYLFFVVPYIVGLVYLAAGIWVFVARRRQSAGRAFTLMCVGLASGCTLLFDIYTTHTFAWLWSGAIPLAAGGLISLALLFPQEQSFVTRWPALRWIPFLLSFVLDRCRLGDDL